MTHLLLTVRFLDDRYHGLLDRGGPVEWPPSPFRLFQALVAGVGRRGELDSPVGQSLRWLQELPAPIIIAPKAKPGQAITRFVPNNDGDKKCDRQERLTAKYTQPTLFLLEPEQKPEVHYAWSLDGQKCCPWKDIDKAARSLTTLGWGIDMAFASATIASEAALQTLRGVRWYPKDREYPFDETLRVPTYDRVSGECTLCDLRHCHSTFINRIEHGRPLKTVDKPKVFERVLYTSIERPIGRPYMVFKLVDGKGEVILPPYPHAKLIHIAGMVKHVAIDLMRKNPPRDLRDRTHEDWLGSYVSGHQSKENKAGDAPHTQVSYVPLPSVGHAHTDPGVRRVMIIAPIGDDDWLEHLARMLDGQMLKPLPNTHLPEGTLLQRVADRTRDGVRDAYTQKSCVWASFTPVILPGHDDHKPDKTRKLILKALVQSGIDQPCRFEWGAFSHFCKSYSAHKYTHDESVKDGKRRIGYIRPDHLLGQTAVHLRLEFDHDVPGPITIGAGRHCGFGLMAACR